MKCQNCNSELVKYIESIDSYICFNCDAEFKVSEKIDSNQVNHSKRSIFISYGHDKYENIAFRLKDHLVERGHKVWIDKELKVGDDWEIKIENALNELIENKSQGCMVLLMSPHSVRRPDGFCLNELAVAVSNNLKTYPIKVAEVTPPLSIARIQWIDMIDCAKMSLNNSFSFCEKQIKALTNAVEKDKIDSSSTLSKLLYHLKPIHFSLEIEKYTKNFIGREWLLNDVKEWINNPNSSRVFWITGGPGVGKTAISIWLSHCKVKEIYSWHLCQHSNSITSDPKRAVLSLAYFLATHLSDYRDYLASIDLEDICNNRSVSTIFHNVLIAPLREIRQREEPVVVLLDALDEATHENGTNELAKFIGLNFSQLPSWLKLIVTSRPVNEVTKWFKSLDPYYINANVQNNNEDIYKYVKKRLKGYRDSEIIKITDVVIEKSEGVFLYAEFVCDSIIKKKLKIDEIKQIPVGLENVYESYFIRRFPDLNLFKTKIAPLLKVVVASFIPIKTDTLKKLFESNYNWDEEDWNFISKELGALFSFRDDTILPFHKSIVDWLTNDNQSDYYIGRISGHKIISEWGEKLFNNLTKTDLPKYLREYLPLHFIKTKKNDLVSKLLTHDVFLELRHESFGFDSSIQMLFKDLKELFSYSKEHCNEIINSSLFTNLLSEYRRYFMDNGFFFDLDEMEYEKLLQEVKINEKSIKEQTAILYYFYSKEKFRKVIEIVKELSINFEKDYSFESCQISEVLGLSLRKIGEFSQAESAFVNTINIAKQLNDKYQESIGYMNVAKINYHEVNFKRAYLNNRLGISSLEKTLENQKALNSKLYTSTKLFLAEYNRLFAETCIWNEDVKKAKVLLSLSKEIYDEIVFRDRYYVRFLYTSAQLKIYENLLDEAKLLLNQAKNYSRNNYDKGTISFLMGQLDFFMFIENQNLNCLKSSYEELKFAENIFTLIEARVELLEVKIFNSVLELYTNKSGKQKKEIGNFTANYVWGKYVFNFFIKKLIKTIGDERSFNLRKWRVDTNQDKTNLFICLQD